MYIRFLVAWLMVVGAAASASAGPWTPLRGHGQVIFNVSFYETKDIFDQEGTRQPFEFDGRFDKLETNPFVELGLTNELTLLANVFISRQSFTNQFDALSNAGLGDSELGLRYRLTDTDGPVLLAVQGIVKFPTAERGGEVSLGNRQLDAEWRVSIGGSLGRRAQPPFWSVDGGYRWRAKGPADEIRIDGTLGVPVSGRLMFMGQLASNIGMKNADTVDVFGNPTLSPDYDLYRLQGSAVVTLTGAVRLQAAGFVHAAGRNTGAGGGGLVSLWVAY